MVELSYSPCLDLGRLCAKVKAEIAKYGIELFASMSWETADWWEDAKMESELFISRITKTISKGNKLSKRKKRGWFTKEQMAKTSYIKNVTEYCERSGNERKDRYNKKLKKYYVVYEENDTELSEDEERHERKDAEDDGDSDKESKAVQVHTAAKEHGKFKTFTDSLLSRASKISDLINQLESVFSETGKPDDDPDAQVACLEDSIAVLEKHFELCETVKVETSELGREGLDDDTKSQRLKKIDAQIRSTTMKCCKVTAAEVGGRNLVRQLRKAVPE
ncbi:unnamed protein product [Cladocopium goreaui]|uniref:Uncharacterized protein n=1 Tax=Cladocopium goreaui TaxID=2562237 RepID=A0A9P1BXL0_9DINO|nr:unnamed protein product [Cladocopium goreaui]